jgi:hypothetical protein
VEPRRTYAPELLDALVGTPIKVSEYRVAAADFEVTVITPRLTYGLRYQDQQAAEKERAKRRAKGSVEKPTSLFDEFKNWAEYVGEFRPVIIVDARPKLVEGFWSAFGRGLSASQGMYGGPARLHFKSDFHHLELWCGDKEIMPIHPGKVEHRVQANNASVNVNDASYEGLYTFPPDAIGPQCGKVGIVLYTEKDPEHGDARALSGKLVQRVWDDFEPYRRSLK